MSLEEQVTSLELSKKLNSLPLEVDGCLLSIHREKGLYSWDVSYNTSSNIDKEIRWEQGDTIDEAVNKMLIHLIENNLLDPKTLWPPLKQSSLESQAHGWCTSIGLKKKIVSLTVYSLSCSQLHSSLAQCSYDTNTMDQTTRRACMEGGATDKIGGIRGKSYMHLRTTSTACSLF